ncbi:MAG: putative metalloprotease CJM1_0395 family protein [Gammaproteobacteria bacterium]
MEISHASHGASPLYSAGNLQSAGANNGSNNSAVKNESNLDEKEKQQVQKLKERDREVRSHEQAHKSAAGGLAGAITYQYKTGPDGKQYVTEGEVEIDTAPVRDDPEATVRKAKQIQKAATAPAEPSAQDMQVAAQAFAMEQQAQIEKREKKVEEDDKDGGILSAAKADSDKSNDSLKTSQSGKEEKADGAVCAICGGTHTGETHTQANKDKLDKIFEIAKAETTSSIFIVSQLA